MYNTLQAIVCGGSKHATAIIKDIACGVSESYTHTDFLNALIKFQSHTIQLNSDTITVMQNITHTDRQTDRHTHTHTWHVVHDHVEVVGILEGIVQLWEWRALIRILHGYSNRHGNSYSSQVCKVKLMTSDTNKQTDDPILQTNRQTIQSYPE